MDKQLRVVVLYLWGFGLVLVTIVFVYSSIHLTKNQAKNQKPYYTYRYRTPATNSETDLPSFLLPVPSRGVHMNKSVPLSELALSFTNKTGQKDQVTMSKSELLGDKDELNDQSSVVVNFTVPADSTTQLPATKDPQLNDSLPQIISESKPGKVHIDCEQDMPDLEILWKRLVIVTAFSENHALEGMGMIASAQKRMKHQRIIVYDLGLANTTLLQLSKLCDVEVRQFDFNKYPPHVAVLGNFAWKVIIIKETLFEFGAIFFGDTSVRFRHSLRSLFTYLHLHHGFMFHILSYDASLSRTSGKGGKSLLEMTSPKMFQELGVDFDEFNASHNSSIHISGGRLLMVNDSVINTKLLKPLYDCSMKQECISPDGASKKNHHYDQSAMSILLSNNMRNEWTIENSENSTDQFDKVVSIHHVQTMKKNQLKYCT